MKHQSQSFPGVGAKHQNTTAEWAIQRVIYMDRTFMVHISFNWSEWGVDDLPLWGFAVKHAVWLQNWMSNRLCLIHYNCSPKPRLKTYSILMHGGPTFVFDPKFTEWEASYKINWHSWPCKFMVFYDLHSYLVINVWSLNTAFIVLCIMFFLIICLKWC